jgi:hypothetical protein
MPSQPVDKLFDDIQRLDSSYALATESTFDWLNRVDRDDCARVRALLEEWYSHYPDEWKADLRPRFQKRNEVSILAHGGNCMFSHCIAFSDTRLRSIQTYQVAIASRTFW